MVTEKSTDFYLRLLNEAYRNVVKSILEDIAANGTRHDQAIYLTFETNRPDVKIPENLRAQWPQEITIVIDKEFYHLTVHDDRFSIELSFDDHIHLLTIPFRSLKLFADHDVVLPMSPSAAEQGAAISQNKAGLFDEKSKNLTQLASEKIISFEDLKKASQKEKDAE